MENRLSFDIRDMFTPLHVVGGAAGVGSARAKHSSPAEGDTGRAEQREERSGTRGGTQGGELLVITVCTSHDA